MMIKYRVESSNHDGWQPFGPGATVCNRANEWYYLEPEEAIKSLRRKANLARIVWPLRAISSEGRVIATYDPMRDTRLPGCRWMIVQRNAHTLWENAGRPEGDGKEFWFQAERELVESDGVEVLGL